MSEIEQEVDLLAIAKQVQKSRIGHSFLRGPNDGYEVSAGYRMDSTRESLDNLTRLRNRMIEKGETETTIRDFDNQFHGVSEEELTGIIGELTDFGLSLYQHKWELENMIDAAETVEAVELVNW